MVLRTHTSSSYLCIYVWTVANVVSVGEDGRTNFVYYLSAEYASGPATVASLVIIKRPLPLDSTVPLQQQLQVLNFPLGPSRSAQDAVSPYESLHSIVRYGVAPCFEANTRGESEQTARRGKGSDDAKTGMSQQLAPLD
jgi:dynein heavy chain 1, cytosolic